MIWIACANKNKLNSALHMFSHLGLRWSDGRNIGEYYPDVNPPLYICIDESEKTVRFSRENYLGCFDIECELSELPHLLKEDETICVNENEGRNVQGIEMLSSGISFCHIYKLGMPKHCLIKHGVRPLGNRIINEFPIIEAIKSDAVDIFDYAGTQMQYAKLKWLVDYYRGDAKTDYFDSAIYKAGISSDDDLYFIKRELRSNIASVTRLNKKIKVLEEENSHLKEVIKEQRKYIDVGNIVGKLSRAIHDLNNSLNNSEE